MANNKSWQSRMTAEQDSLAVNFVESISYDKRLFQYDIDGSIAHARMLSEQGLITNKEFSAIKKGLEEIGSEMKAGKFSFDVSCEDIHMVIEAALIARIGDAGKKLHTGRSRNDQVALDMRMWARDEADIITELLKDLQAALVELAHKQGQVVMPSFTHLQRAQPIISGHYLLAYVEMFQRDRERLADARKRINVSPIGSGAVAGSTLPLDRKRTAELLEFPVVSRNSIDSISDRDFCIELVFCCSTAAMHLSRLAEDWIIFMTEEFGFIRLSDAFCTSSSMMPQKRNPDMLELIRGKTGRVYGSLVSLLTMMKSQPLAYNRDMQEDKERMFDAVDTLRASLAIMAAMVRTVTFREDRISDGLDRGFLDATALAEYFVSCGMPFRQSHQVVGRLVAQCEKQGIKLAQLPLEAFTSECVSADASVYKCLDPANVTRSYKSSGAGGVKQLKDQLKFWDKQLSKSL
ncbi:MAG: argininosuccinate lyase [Sedimentisphaerales bacterium]|nr:argininosuccinate lyase [Sedimentisphaerales bacterium]MBN2841692.1 argininosuccinate lyase [Sedimentisphaerales bacterium]